MSYRNFFHPRSLVTLTAPAFFLSAAAKAETPKVEPNWDSMKAAYECPEWFRDSKFGIFLHFGVNSVPGYNGHYARHMYWQEKPDVTKGTGWTKIHRRQIRRAHGGASRQFR